MVPLYKRKGFDTKKYLEAQTKAIKDRLDKFNQKLYLEFGGKLCYDGHATRVLPGYEPTTKVQLLKKLKDFEIIYCVSAKDIQRGKLRGDLGLTYDKQTLKDISDIFSFDLNLLAVVITKFEGESLALRLKQKLENAGIKVYTHYKIEGYPKDIDKIISETGYGKQPYIKTTKPIVIVTGTGPGSGKLATCLAQIYHDQRQGIKSGYAKFETFPIWNLPLDHPVNIAYEAATADLGDFNVVDPFHKEVYGIVAINYNRDVESFGLVKELLKRVLGKEIYRSPTDMGVNMAKEGIINDKVVRAAARQEIIRRYFRYKKERIEGIETQDTVDRMEKIMAKAKVDISGRKVVNAARKAAQVAKKEGKGYEGIYCGAAIELPNGQIVSGKNSPLLHAESAAVLNAGKRLAKIPDEIDLISSQFISSVILLKKNIFGKKDVCLNVEEILIALAMSAPYNPMAERVLAALKELKGCEMHLTHIPNEADEYGLIKLGVNFTCDAELALRMHFEE